MTAPRFVTIRMYHVGFGDCLLLRFPGRGRDRLVLIDCGVHSASAEGHDLSEVVGDVIETAVKVTGKRMLDVVAMTHRHRDHVHGFRDERWREVEVGEVWFPWTEDPDDPEALRILDKQSKRARLLMGLAADSAGTYWSAVRAIGENNDRYTNAAAMAMLHGGFAGPAAPSYLPEQNGEARASRFASPVLPQVTVDVLGPQRSEAAIRDLDPPAQGSYVRLGMGGEIGAFGRSLPFERWAVEEPEYRSAYAHLALTSGDIGAVMNAGRDTALGVAVALEKAVNGTSLVLLFRIGNLSLLFAGDAQWGTWDAVLRDPEKRQLLDNLDVYKVGHHGSHNATPREFVEDIPRSGAVALVPVAPTRIPSWSQIPRKPLLEALGSHGAYVIRSDRWEAVRDDHDGQAAAGLAAGEVTVEPTGLWTEVRLPVDRQGET